MYTLKQNLVSKDKYYLKCPHTMKAAYITMHDTANSGSATNEIKYTKEYMLNYLSKHYNGQNLRQLSRELGYSDRWIGKLMKRYEIETKLDK